MNQWKFSLNQVHGTKLLAELVGAKSSSEQDIIDKINQLTKFKSPEDQERILAGFRWLGLFSENQITPRGNPLDTLCATLEELMQYEKVNVI